MRWFKPLGPFFVPVSFFGLIVTALAAAFCAQVFLAINHQVHSVSDLLYGVFPFWVPTLLLWDTIASRTSSQRP